MNLQANFTAAAIGLAIALPAAADVTMTVDQIGPDVVISGSGSFDLSLAIGSSTFSFTPTAFEFGVLTGATAPTLIRNLALTGNFSGPEVIPGPNSDTFADEASGDMFGVEWGSGTRNVYVPVGYVDGTPLQGSMTFSSRTIESMNFVPGETYNWSWDTTTGTDSFTLKIAPEPTSLVALVVGGISLVRRRG